MRNPGLQRVILGSRRFDPAIYFSGAKYGPGAFFDFSDTAYLFADQNGQTPATVGGTIGLAVSSERGRALASHSAYSDNHNTASWSASAGGWSALGPNSIQCDGTQAGSTLWSTASANIPAVDNQIVRWTFTVTAINGAITVSPSSTGTPSITTTGTYVVYGIGSSTAGFTAPAAGRTCTITNISIDYIQAHAIRQGTSAARPILRQDATTGYYYAEVDGADDRLVLFNTLVPVAGNTRGQVIIAVRKESDAAMGIAFCLASSTGALSSLSVLAPGGAAANFGLTARGSLTTTQRNLTPPSGSWASPYTAVVSAKYDLAGNTIAEEIFDGLVNGATPTYTDVSGPSTNATTLSVIHEIGATSAGASPMTGRIYGYAMHLDQTYWTDAEVRRISNYFATRCGVSV